MINIDAQDIQDLVLEVLGLVILGICKLAADFHQRLLLLREPHFLLILCILCIDVHKQSSTPPRRTSLRLTALLVRTPLSSRWGANTPCRE